MGEVVDKNALITVLQIIRKFNFKETEEILRREGNLTEDQIRNAISADTDISSVLAAYQSEGDPESYEEAYNELKKFVENALDTYKYELGLIMYPVLVHMYIELIVNGHMEKSKKLLDRFAPEQSYCYQNDLKKLALVRYKNQMADNDLIEAFKSNQFIIRISRDTLSLLKRHLREKKATILMNIVQEHLYFDMYEGVARNRGQIESSCGAVFGEATRQNNKNKVFYGIPKEPDIHNLLTPVVDDDDDDAADGSDKPKKKKLKRDPLFSKKTKSDPNAPPSDRMPFPKLKDYEKIEKVKALRESVKRIQLNADSLPSVCCFTLLNTYNNVICAEVNEDSSMLAVGLNNSIIRIWSLTPQKLKAMKHQSQLMEIDKEADDVWTRMMDDRTSESTRTFYGHSGPVYHLSFSPDKTFLLSCSEDATIRLWSLQIWSCLVVYRAHMYPVWDVKFSPFGYYFASASHDKTARLWITDHHQPIRVFFGHFSDVDCVQFHPNANYVATGSSDRTVALWDCITGNQVRLMTGHKDAVHSLVFSNDGRYLISSGMDCNVLVWDLSNGNLISRLTGHKQAVHSLVFSRDGTILATGGLDSFLRLWDFSKLIEEMSNEDSNASQSADIKSGDTYLLKALATKNSPIINLSFTRRNLLYAVAVFKQ